MCTGDARRRRVDRGGVAARSGPHHADARRDDFEFAVVTHAVLRRRLADDLGERELNEPSDVHPTVTHVSVTDIP